MSEHLQSAKEIRLIRCPNGWMARDNVESPMAPAFVFESTESLARNLVKLVGKSGWKVEQAMPKRDEKGHFIKSAPDLIK